MKALFALLAAALLAPTALAQSLVPTSGNGAAVASGAVAPRIQFVVRNDANQPQAGVTVTFEPQCTYRMRGETGPYACVTVVPGESLTVVSDGSGNVSSPLYQADGPNGTAWVTATMVVDGRVITNLPPFYWSVGPTVRLPLGIVSGSNQVVQSGFSAEPLVARVVDDFGRPVPGVPVSFTSSCTSPLPCLLAPTTIPRLVSDAFGYVDSGVRPANSVGGSYNVLLTMAGVSANLAYSITNVLPVRSTTVRTITGDTAFIRMIEAPATCSVTFIEAVNYQHVPVRPYMLATPEGVIGATIGNCPVGAKVSFSLQHPGAMPEGSRIWTARPQWRPLASTNPIEGFWDFSITDGGEGDADGVANGKIEMIMAVAFGDPAVPRFDDLWWVGPVENGWGISIVQHGDILFVVVFAYDAAGQPTWYVMPGGSWDATRETYTGRLYSPRGRPLHEHLARDFAVGAPVGTLALTFSDMMSARAVLTIGGAQTLRFIERQFFGVREASVTGRYGDMYYPGASRDGWGLVLHQQFASMFALLFTYGTDGRPTWFAMPSITRNQNDVFEGIVYRTTSSSWPADYDPGALQSRDAGSFRVQFINGAAQFDLITPTRSDRFTLSRIPF